MNSRLQNHLNMVGLCIMDDLVIQFDTTDLGHRFAEAWKRARIIVDAGTGQGNNPLPPPAPNAVPGHP